MTFWGMNITVTPGTGTSTSMRCANPHPARPPPPLTEVESIWRVLHVARVREGEI